MLDVLYTIFLQVNETKENVIKKITKKKIHLQYCTVFIYIKKPHISGPAQLKPMTFKGQLYSLKLVQLGFVNILSIFKRHFSFHVSIKHLLAAIV